MGSESEILVQSGVHPYVGTRCDHISGTPRKPALVNQLNLCMFFHSIVCFNLSWKVLLIWVPLSAQMWAKETGQENLGQS